MNDRAIPQLPPATTLANSDLAVIFQGGQTRNMSLAQLRTFAAAGILPNVSDLVAATVACQSSAFTLAADTAVPWQTLVSGSSTIWNSGTPTRLTVPADAAAVTLTGNIFWGLDTAAHRCSITFNKNGASYVGSPRTYYDMPALATGAAMQNIHQPVIPVTPGDYFELVGFASTANARNIPISNFTWATLQVVAWS